MGVWEQVAAWEPGSEAALGLLREVAEWLGQFFGAEGGDPLHRRRSAYTAPSAWPGGAFRYSQGQVSSASSFCNAAFSAFTDSNSDFKCSTSSALEAFRYCLMKLWQRNGRR